MAARLAHGSRSCFGLARPQVADARRQRRLGIQIGRNATDLNGGRYRDRTYGPYHVKVVLSR